MPMPKARGQTEAEVSATIIKFEKEFMGRGPLEAKTFIVEDLVVVRLRSVLTPAELKLAGNEDEQKGRELIKQVRMELIEHARPLLGAAIKDITGTEVKSLHTDISTRTGERIIVFTLETTPEFEK